MTIFSSNQENRFEEVHGRCLLVRRGDLVWQSELELGEGSRRLHLSNSGWLVAETSGTDWALVTVVAPDGQVTGRWAVTDCRNRETWPPKDLPLVVLGGDGWPWCEGEAPGFFEGVGEVTYFWWLLPSGSRFVIHLEPGQVMDWSEVKPLESWMANRELEWALAYLEVHSGPGTELLASALATVIRQNCKAASGLLVELGQRLTPGPTRTLLAAPSPALCPVTCQLKLALWILEVEARPQLDLWLEMTSLDVFELAGPPDYAGPWRPDGCDEDSEVWVYYLADGKQLQIAWEPGSSGSKIHQIDADFVSRLVEDRAARLVRGWLQGSWPAWIYRLFPVAPSESAPGLHVAPDEVDSITVYSHHHSIVPTGSEKLRLLPENLQVEALAALMEAVNSPALAEPCPEQMQISRPALLAHYKLCVDDDNPGFLVCILLKSGQVLRLRTFSYHDFMLPWSIRLEDGAIIKSFNLNLSKAVATLLPDDFLDRGRLLKPRHGLRERPPREHIGYRSNPEVLPSDPNELDRNGETALMRARAFEKRFEELVQAGADLEVLGRQGLTGLQMACLWEKSEVVLRWLRFGAKLETPNQEGRTALMLAAHRPEILKLLLDHGASVDALDSKNDNALDLAVCAQEAESVRFLLAAGCLSERARDYAHLFVQNAELELERGRAFEHFYSEAERAERQKERLTWLEEMQAQDKFGHNWLEDPQERALSRARTILKLVQA